MTYIQVAEHAGFCFGVKRAVDTVTEIAGEYQHIYTLGELIHNKDVIADLEKKGIQVTDDIESVKQDEDTLIVIRSHGVARQVLQAIKSRGFDILDLTCPFVKRIHNKVKHAGEKPVIIVGSEDHPEVMGIKGWTTGEVFIVNSKKQASNLPIIDRALVVAQTTITQQMWTETLEGLQQVIGELEIFNTICDTTQKRQKEAAELAKKSDVVLVVGGKHSSNTEKLYQICINYCDQTHYIDNIKQIEQIILENIANHDIISIVAGASTPDWLIREVKTRMSVLDEKGQEAILEEQDQNEQDQVDETEVTTDTDNVAANQEGTEPEVVDDSVADDEATDDSATDDEVADDSAADDEAEESEEKTEAADIDIDAKDDVDFEESFMAEIEKSFVYIKRGEIVEGTVVQISEDEVCVNIGYKSDGIIKRENLTTEGDANPEDLFKVGDDIEAEVISLNDNEGNVVLSRKSIESKLKWQKLIEDIDDESVFTVKVYKVVKGGVLAKLNGYDAFIPASHLSLRYVEDLSEFVDQELEVNVLEIDKRQRRFVLSHKKVLQKEAEEKEKKLYDTFNKGDKVTGKIKRLTDFGAFIDVGGVDGLLHITDIAWARIKHPSDILKTGEEIEVLILNVDKERRRISLGLKQLTPKPWDLAPEKYIVGDTVEGTVVRIMPFGAFVNLEPTIDGLIHISQITNRRLEKVEEELRIGDKVTVKIMDVDPERKRISLSMRALMDEPERPDRAKKERREREERYDYVLPPVEGATSSLADFFPKQEDEDSQDNED